MMRINSISQHIGSWVANLSPKQIPDEVLAIAKRCVTDTMAVAAAGSDMQVSKSLRNHVSTHYGSGVCTLIGDTRCYSIPGAALANGVAAHALDFDDTSYAGIVHGSAIVLPAVLAASEYADTNSADFLTAFIAGSEVIYALGLSLSDHHYLKGWWATSTLGAIGAAAGTAKALGLDDDKTSTAIALAAVQANGMSAIFGSDAKPLIAGQAARLGVESALLADSGFCLPDHVFEDPRGFVKLMNDGISSPARLEELGQIWRLVNPGIAIKRTPVCSAAQAAIEAIEHLITSNGLEGTQVKTVICHVPHLVKISLVHNLPATPPQAQFSMPFAIGCILTFGMLGPQQISDETLANTQLQNAMSKVSMIEDDQLNGPEFQPHFPECARVSLTMSDGRTFTHFVGAATGTPENPLSNNALENKLRVCTSFAGWEGKATDNLLTNLQTIDKLSSIRALLRRNA